MEPRETNERLAGEIARTAMDIKDGLGRGPWKKPVVRALGTPGLPVFLEGAVTLISLSRAFAEARGDFGMVVVIDNTIRRLSALTTSQDSAATVGTDVDSIKPKSSSVFLDQGRVAWEEPVEEPSQQPGFIGREQHYG
ncbi:hypothetical protein HYW44_03690 [Candidatus Daviesbacteria bacterium]|nr:hypothetical protein [Candidatus Daviesbacteria bacterium]